MPAADPDQPDDNKPPPPGPDKTFTQAELPPVPAVDPGPDPGFVRMTHPDIGGYSEMHESTVAIWRARGWVPEGAPEPTNPED